jgi:hypothetical protein
MDLLHHLFSLGIPNETMTGLRLQGEIEDPRLLAFGLDVSAELIAWQVFRFGRRLFGSLLFRTTYLEIKERLS